MTCTACESCALDPDPGCCTPCPTPDTVHVTILAVAASSNCSYEVAAPFRVYKLDVSGLVGRTFALPYGPADCCWEDTFDVTAWVRMLRCIGNGTGCGACVPSEDITTSSSVKITFCHNGTVSFTWFMTTPDQGGPFAITNNSDPLSDADPVPCCTTFTLTGTALNGSEDMLTIAVTSVGVTPC